MSNQNSSVPELPEEVLPEDLQDFYKELAEGLIKSSIERIETNAQRSLTLLTLIATLYAATAGFWVTKDNPATPIGAVLLAIPELLLILSVMFVARVVMPVDLKLVSPLCPSLTHDTHQEIVEDKTKNMKHSFELLILALVAILVVMLLLSLFRGGFLQKVV
jgi:ABC-type dipeptide/oligopeptide/nickel transport system permease subunit